MKSMSAHTAASLVRLCGVRVSAIVTIA